MEPGDRPDHGDVSSIKAADCPDKNSLERYRSPSPSMEVNVKVGVSEECPVPCEDRETIQKKKIPKALVLAYGFGHFFNDLCAATWFTYLLIYLDRINIPSRDAGFILLSGQVADGVATLVMGWLIDAYGHRKRWHGAGAIVVAASFSFVFSTCVLCLIFHTNTVTFKTVMYSTFAAIFNIGWAIVQIAHMSVVPALSRCCQNNVVALNGSRNAFTNVANLLLYGIAGISFLIYEGKSKHATEGQFRLISIVVIALGSVFCIAYLILVPEPKSIPESELRHGCEREVKWTQWLTRLRYYLVAAMYTCARLCINISTAILPFFLTDNLGLPNLTIAEAPAVIYTISVLISILLQRLHWEKDRLAYAYGFGCVVWFMTASAIFLAGNLLGYSVFAISVAVGTGNTLMLVSSISMEAELVGDTQKGGAFVYGSLSFLDKIICGMAIFVVEAMKGEEKDTTNTKSHMVVYYSVAGVPGFAACIGLFCAVIYLFDRRLKRMQRSSSINSIEETKSLQQPLLE